MRNRNIDILEHIRDYCIDIGNTMQRFGNEKSVFEADMDYRNSICMSLLQIGELTGHLTEEFRDSTKERMFIGAS